MQVDATRPRCYKARANSASEVFEGIAGDRVWEEAFGDFRNCSLINAEEDRGTLCDAGSHIGDESGIPGFVVGHPFTRIERQEGAFVLARLGPWWL